MSLDIFKRTLKYVDPKQTNTMDYIFGLSQEDYNTFLILTHALEVFEIRGIKSEPQYSHNQNLYCFQTKELQILYHKTKDLEEKMLNKECESFLFIEPKIFQKQDKRWEKKYNIHRINCRHMLIPLIDKFILKIEVKKSVEFYKGLNVDNKFPITLVSDPQVAILGAHKGDVIIYHRVSYDQSPYVEIEIQYVDVSQNKAVQLEFEGSDEDMIADGLVVGKDEEEQHDEFKETKVEDDGAKTDDEQESDINSSIYENSETDVDTVKSAADD